jgi:hypothetical protein
MPAPADGAAEPSTFRDSSPTLQHTCDSLEMHNDGAWRKSYRVGITPKTHLLCYTDTPDRHLCSYPGSTARQSPIRPVPRLIGKVSPVMNAQSLQYQPEDFETVAEAEVDSRGRVSLGKAGAEPGRRYRVERNIDGVLILTPVVSIPEREMIVWRNPELAAAVRQGIAEAEAGQTTDRGSFAQYAEDAEDED